MIRVVAPKAPLPCLDLQNVPDNQVHKHCIMIGCWLYLFFHVWFENLTKRRPTKLLTLLLTLTLHPTPIQAKVRTVRGFAARYGQCETKSARPPQYV